MTWLLTSCLHVAVVIIPKTHWNNVKNLLNWQSKLIYIASKFNCKMRTSIAESQQHGAQLVGCCWNLLKQKLKQREWNKEKVFAARRFWIYQKKYLQSSVQKIMWGVYYIIWLSPSLEMLGNAKKKNPVIRLQWFHTSWKFSNYSVSAWEFGL